MRELDPPFLHRGILGRLFGEVRERPQEEPPQLRADQTHEPVFGGRPLPWWTERLNALRSGPGKDPRLFDLTVIRARANGLEVEVKGDAVSIRLSPSLAQLVGAPPSP